MCSGNEPTATEKWYEIIIIIFCSSKLLRSMFPVYALDFEKKILISRKKKPLSFQLLFIFLFQSAQATRTHATTIEVKDKKNFLTFDYTFQFS